MFYDLGHKPLKSQRIDVIMKTRKILKILITPIIFASIISVLQTSDAFEFSWQIDETPEGQESATAVEPIEVTLLDQPIQVSPHSASIFLINLAE